MKKYNIKIAILSIIVMLSGCTDNFIEINTDPNGASDALPASLISPAIYSTLSYNLGRNKALNNELMQVTVTLGNTNDIHRYDVRATYSDGPWNAWYTQLNNFRDMYSKGEVLGEDGSKGISLILDCWVTSLLTDTYGDVPDTEACRGREELFQPKYDKQKDIYLRMFDKLEEANTLLSTANTTEIFKRLDLLYAGNTTLWRKFGNSLYLRLLMRLSNLEDDPDLDIKARVKNILDTNPKSYPVFEKNEESAILYFTGENPLKSPFATNTNNAWNGSAGLANFFIDNLNNWKDPRLPIWATEASLGQYYGMESGYASGNTPDIASKLQLALREEPRLGNIMNYSELNFIIAEAGVRKWTNIDPETTYRKGIAADIYLWVDTLSAEIKDPFKVEKFNNYMEQPSIKWDALEGDKFKLEKILLQKYYSLFFTDFQQWCDYRRTGQPEMPIGPGVLGSMPTRLKYPVYVQNLNRENYNAAVKSMGGDDIRTKLWWQK